ncbi:MAG: HD domain-containing protein [Clostridia bacterium]|nr:HD domain-containing protein [Clostridia bacterium]
MLLDNGWKNWNIERDRVESVAEHIYGTCILAIAIDSEYKIEADLEKVVFMLVIHELEEIYIGDLTPFDKISIEEKRKIGKEAVEKVLDGMLKQEEYVKLTEEFNDGVTNESRFAKLCDKLECDIQCKIYCEENCLSINKEENQIYLKNKFIDKLIKQGANSISDLFIENDRNIFKGEEVEEIANYVKENNILKFRDGGNKK